MRINFYQNTPISYTGNPKKLYKLVNDSENVYKKAYPCVQSLSHISKFRYFDDLDRHEVNDIASRLSALRNCLKNEYSSRGSFGYFSGLISFVKQMNVANCNEMAELTYIILKMNKVKNANMFMLGKQKVDGTVQALDHVLVGVDSRHKQYKAMEAFRPDKNMIIVDNWLDNFMGDFAEGETKLRQAFYLKPGEKFVLQALDGYTPDEKSIEKLRKMFPHLIA